MKTKQSKTKILGLAALVIFGLGTILAIAGFSNTVGKLENKAESSTPEAILASADIEDGKEINLPVAYYDQRADQCVDLYDAAKTTELKTRQFGWTDCDYSLKELEQGLVAHSLSDKYLPVATSAGVLIANRGVNDFSRWFSSVEGKSQSYSGTIKLNYNRAGAIFTYESDAFYPLDEVEFSKNDTSNKDGHNHLFTMNFAVPFTVLKSGNETFEVSADDDTFVFVGSELVLDMGGVHDVITGKILVNENGEVYSAIGDEELAYSGVTLKNEESIIRIFHADRDSIDSVFKIRFSGMNLNVLDTRLAGNDGEIQIAYDPTDPSFVAPLGESATTRPDTTRGYVVMASIFGLVIMALSMLIAIFAHHMLRVL